MGHPFRAQFRSSVRACRRSLTLFASLALVFAAFGIASNDAAAGRLVNADDSINRRVANTEFTSLARRSEFNIEVLYRTSSAESRRTAEQVLNSLPTAMSIVRRVYPNGLEGDGPGGIHQVFVEDGRLLNVRGINDNYDDNANGPTATVVETGSYARRGDDFAVLVHELTHAGQVSAIGSGRHWNSGWLAEGLAVLNETNLWTSTDTGARRRELRERELAEFDRQFLFHQETSMAGSTHQNYDYGSFRFFVWLNREMGSAFVPAVRATFNALRNARVTNQQLHDIDAFSEGLRSQGRDLGTLLAQFRLAQYEQNVAVQRAVRRLPGAFSELRNDTPIQLSANFWGARLYRFIIPPGARNVHITLDALRPGGRLLVSNGGQVEDWTSQSGDALFRVGVGFSAETVRTIPAIAGTELLFMYVNAGITQAPTTSPLRVTATSDDPEELARRFTLFNLLRRSASGTGSGGASQSGSTNDTEDAPGRTGVRIDPGITDTPAENPAPGDRVRIDIPQEEDEGEDERDDYPERRPNRGRRDREDRRVADLPLCPGAFANSGLADLPMIPTPQYNPRATEAWARWAARNPQGARGTVNEYNVSTPRPPVNPAWDAAWERTLFALRDNDWTPGLNGYLRTLDGRPIVDHNWEPVRAEYIQAADGNYYYTGRLVTARGEPREQIRDSGSRTHESGPLLNLRVYETRVQRQLNEFQRRLHNGIRDLLVPSNPGGTNPNPRIVPFWPFMRLLVDNANPEICPTRSCPRVAASTSASSYRPGAFRPLIGSVTARATRYSCNPPDCPPDGVHLPPERWEQLSREPGPIRDYFGKDGDYLSYCLSKPEVLGAAPCGTFAWNQANHVWGYGVRAGSSGSYEGTC